MELPRHACKVKEAAAMLGLTHGRICQLIRAGEFPAVKWGQEYIIDRQYVERLKKSRQKTA